MAHLNWVLLLCFAVPAISLPSSSVVNEEEKPEKPQAPIAQDAPFDWLGYSIPQLQLKSHQPFLSQDITEQLNDHINKMDRYFRSRKICAWNKGQKDCSEKWDLDTIMGRMGKSRDYKELVYIWSEWREKTKVLDKSFEKLVDLSNKGAEKLGFNDTAEWWRSMYEKNNRQFTEELDALYFQILPLYERLHALVKLRLQKMYPNGQFSASIPAHALGNMWAQNWQSLYPDVHLLPPNHPKNPQMNDLFKEALDKVAFMPFAYTLEKWRTFVYEGTLKKNFWNKGWWDMRFIYQGVVPPVPRSRDSFDPVSKSHIVKNEPYIQYFITSITKFQFFKNMCELSHHRGPLHTCSLYRNLGEDPLTQRIFGRGGGWNQAYRQASGGQTKLNAVDFLDFFYPLEAIIDEQVRQENGCYGWGHEWGAEIEASLPKPRCAPPVDRTSEAVKWLDEFEKENSKMLDAAISAAWNYSTDITDANQQASIDSEVAYSSFKRRKAEEAKEITRNSYITDPKISRLLEKISIIGVNLDDEKTAKLSKIKSTMESIYSTATICSVQIETMKKDCGTKWILSEAKKMQRENMNNYWLQQYIWEEWREQTGKKMKKLYKEYVELSNLGATNDGFEDAGDIWRSEYEDANFKEELEKLWHQVLPLYEQLHTYMRKNLRKKHPGKLTTNAIPSHILGNMWAQTWENLFKDTLPYPGLPSIDITDNLKAQNYTAEGIYRASDEFFTSLGLIPMPDSFWTDSLFEKPKDREVVCHASAWDFLNGKDFRVKHCTEITMTEFVVAHHEMGHVEYFLQYAKQPTTFRTGANPGFHEAIGDAIALSVSTPQHLQAVGLLKDYEPNPQQDLNYLYQQALDKIAFLPFGYMTDLWRWSVFDGSSKYDDWTADWKKLRYKYQGIESPIPRTSEDFDPGSKYHIPGATPYVRYFVSFIIQFEFYKEMCKEAGHTGPLHTCDFYRSKPAGDKLAKILELGYSKHWREAMRLMTGSSEMSAAGLLEYFDPLMRWLKKQNQGECFGWGYQWPQNVRRKLATPRCPSDKTEEAKAFLDQYNREAQVELYKAVEGSWQYQVDVTQAKRKKNTDASSDYSEWAGNMNTRASELYKHVDRIHDPGMRKLLKNLATVGISLLPEESQRMQALIGDMTQIYSQGKICSYNTNTRSKDCSKMWDLEVDLKKVLSEARDYDMLVYIFKEWRDATGKKMKSKYRDFVKLSNKGSQLQGDSMKDTGDVWKAKYDDPMIEDEIIRLWREVLPLYEQIHSYMRKKLRKMYPGRFNSSAIPSHILADMWGQVWTDLYEDTAPFPGKGTLDVTDTLVAKGYRPKMMFNDADQFFQSLGMIPMPKPFWEKSMIEKPKDRKVVCHATAWDFYNANDYRIKMCTRVNMDDYIVIHHEMGHVQYFLQYSGQPVTFREGANPAFHEAIGDTISLSVSTPEHLKTIGLLPDYKPDMEQDLNYQYRQALGKIPFLPFGLIVDLWRWRVFNGTSNYDTMNQDWWDLRYQYQGLVPPIERSSDDFDPGSKYHVPANAVYMRYFMSYIIQFQFYKSMCEAAGHTGPLYQCDFYNSKAAGESISRMLKLGMSRHWRDAMFIATGSREMSAEPLKEYFQPILNYLNEQNKYDCFGWGYEWPSDWDLPQPRCPKTMQ